MITIKHLCQKYAIDPPKARRIARKAIGKARGRHKWQEGSKLVKKLEEAFKAASSTHSQAPR